MALLLLEFLDTVVDWGVGGEWRVDDEESRG